MDIKIEKYYNISSVKKAWQELYAANPKLTPFQDYVYMRNYFIKKCLNIKRGEVSVFYLCSTQQENGSYKPILIAPLTTNIFKKTSTVSILASQDCDFVNFIYAEDLGIDLMKTCITALQKKINKEIELSQVQENTILIDAVKELYPNLSLQKNACVKIPEQKDVESYIASLSSNSRQNVRKAYNRMERDEVKYSLEVAHPIKNNLRLFEEAMEIYVKRQIEQYGFPILWGDEAISNKYFMYLKPESYSLRQMDNTFTSTLKMNDVVAGVIMGFIHEDQKAILIPRIAINPDFSFYSPGSVLIVETMRYILENTDLRVIDLTVGDERYKYKMGGVEYFTCDVVLPKI